MTGRDVEQMTLAELQALLQRMQARVDQLRDAELDVIAEGDANRAPGTRDAGSGAGQS